MQTTQGQVPTNQHELIQEVEQHENITKKKEGDDSWQIDRKHKHNFYHRKWKHYKV